MSSSGPEAKASRIKYTTVTGFFLQDEPGTDSSTFNYTAVDFGLINKTYDTDVQYDPERRETQWQRFAYQVSQLNLKSAKSVQYKLLYVGRHGEGVHNVAENFYGTLAWDTYWSMLEGNDTVTWADAHLTDEGIRQAQIANRFWKAELAVQKIPMPQRYYTSPLHRCLATAQVTFSGLDLSGTQPFIPEVKEFLREVNGVHTCDRRSSKTYLHSEFHSYDFEPGFAENDELWDSEIRESDLDLDSRMQRLLDDIFATDNSTYISLTTHSGATCALQRIVGHRLFRLKPGGVMPIFVRAEKSAGSILPTSSAA